MNNREATGKVAKWDIELPMYNIVEVPWCRLEGGGGWIGDH
jgi:hypothetical protein